MATKLELKNELTEKCRILDEIFSENSRAFMRKIDGGTDYRKFPDSRRKFQNMERENQEEFN